MKFRVILSDADIRKVDIPDDVCNNISMEDFKKILTEKLNISTLFVVQYSDPDFGNEFCNLESTESLRQTNTLKVIACHEATPRVLADSLSPGASLREVGDLPDPYTLPQFDVQVKLILEQKQTNFTDNGAVYLPNKSIKSKMLNTLCEDIYKYKTYPSDNECARVCCELVKKYPCLREKGGPLGYEAWNNSLKFKMGNFRNTLRRTGVTEVLTNGERKSRYKTVGLAPSKDIKKPRRSEANYLPTCTTNDTCQVDIDFLIDEMQRTNGSRHDISAAMLRTYSKRRQEIAGTSPRPLVKDVMLRWPALFSEYELCAEFERLCGIKLLETFFAKLDIFSRCLITLISSRGGAHGPAIAKELEEMHSKGDSVVNERTFVLRCLPMYFNEQCATLYRDFRVGEEQQMSADNLPPFVAIVGEPYCGRCAVVIEETVVLQNIRDFPTAVALFMAIIYAMDLKYPGKLVYDFLQKIVLGLKGTTKMHNKLINLCNKLSVDT